jgi:hypothetical protein
VFDNKEGVFNHTSIMGCDLLMTCYACPEQYDVFLEGTQIGYLRLRHGHFTVVYPDVGGVLVYQADPVGDGIFEASEREHYLIHAIEALLQYKNSLEVASKT